MKKQNLVIMLLLIFLSFVIVSCGGSKENKISTINNAETTETTDTTDTTETTDTTDTTDTTETTETTETTDTTETTATTATTATTETTNTQPGLSVSTVKDGDVLIIRGSNFGEHPDTPLYYDDYRDAQLGDDALDAGLKNLRTDGRGLPEVVDDMAISGGKSLRMDYSLDEENENGSTLEQLPKVGVLVNPSSQTIFVSSWNRFTRYQEDPQNKDLGLVMKRIRAGYGTPYHGKPGFYSSDMFPGSYYSNGWGDGWIYTFDRGYTNSDGEPTRPLEGERSDRINGVMHCKEMNTWHRSDFYEDMGDTGVANGEFRQWLDGIANEQETGILVRKTGFTGGFEWVMSDFCGFSHMNSHNKYYLWMDSFYVSTTQARVELGDNKDFDACTVRFIQPSTSWSDTEISISMRPGTLRGNCYLFVLDEYGKVVNKYSITID